MQGKVKLGLCPIGKFIFSHDDALKYKVQIEKRLRDLGIEYIGIDSVVKDGMVRSQKDVEPAVEFLKSQEIDSVFLPHCNFGTESAAGMIGKKLNVPVLLWGPRDEAPLQDGTRMRDTLCGMFASSKVLYKLGVPFTYIENCNMDDTAFDEGLDKFIRVSNVVKSFRKARIGLIGNRIDFFWSTIFNENELLQKFGIEVMPFDLVKVVRMTKSLASKYRSKYIEEVNNLAQAISFPNMSEEGLINVLALRDVMLTLAREEKLTAFAVESFMSITEELGAMISYAQAAVTDRGIPCVTESDIHGAISSIIVEAAGLNSTPSFLADLTVRHPENENGILLWHDSFPLSLKDPSSPGSLGKHWILPAINSGTCHWKIKDGEVTIARFDGERGDYRLIAEKAKSIPGPYTLNTYLWVQVPNWRRLERHIIEGPYIHHVGCIYGDYVDVLKESSKYIEGLSFEAVD